MPIYIGDITSVSMNGMELIPDNGAEYSQMMFFTPEDEVYEPIDGMGSVHVMLLEMTPNGVKNMEKFLSKMRHYVWHDILWVNWRQWWRCDENNKHRVRR